MHYFCRRKPSSGSFPLDRTLALIYTQTNPSEAKHVTAMHNAVSLADYVGGTAILPKVGQYAAIIPNQEGTDPAGHSRIG